MKYKLIGLMQSGKIELISSHAKLFFPVIERICKKMSIGIQFDPIKVHNKLIIDGHHRYVASLLAGYKIDRVPSIRSSAKKETAWELVELKEDDWYTAAGIRDLDERDAVELGLTYDQLIEKIKWFSYLCKMLIFLDIDGVMVPAKGWKIPENLEDGFPMFSKKATDALSQLISPDTRVILSTSHRYRFAIDIWKKIFERRGLRIENLSRLEPNENLEKKRKDEILSWFSNNNVRDNFVIIDDDTTLNALPEYLKRNLILTSSTVGLTAEHIAQVQTAQG